MRKTCVEMVYELAKLDERVVFIGSDLSYGLLADMKSDFPDRFFMEGIAENQVFGMAAGMALEGYVPYVNTISTFITRRAYEQIAIDICLQNLPIRIIGNGGGVVYAPLGPTHQAIEDIATMRALPNMTVFASCDATEMQRAMLKTLTWEYPIYIRLGKGGDPLVSKDSEQFEFGKASLLTQQDASKADLVILTTGVMANRAITAAKAMEAEDLSICVIHHHTIKPLDTDSLLDTVSHTNAVLTLEEHSLIGGFGSAVIEALVDNDAYQNVRLKRLGFEDKFFSNYGSQDELLDSAGLSVESICESIRNLTN